MQIEIKGKPYECRYTIRALFIWEAIAGRRLEINTLFDHYLLFYSMILANNPDSPLEWEEFCEALDGDPGLQRGLEKILEDYNRSQSVFETEESGQKKS